MLIQLISRLRRATVLLALISATPLVANDIGSVTQSRGTGEVVRNQTKYNVRPQLPIRQNDTVKTGNGRVRITFVDDSTVNVTEQSRLVIDDFVYNGNPSASRMALRFASGTARFTSGSGRIAKPNIALRTPSATIAVRGTDFTTTVDEFGKSLIILLPSDDGTVGEITVSNAAGIVVLNQAFQATLVETFDSRPSQPLILNLSLDMIDNMIIVNPPEEIKEYEITDSRTNILDLSELDIDYLEFKDLEKDDLIFDQLDKDLLSVNFLEDYLDDSGGDLSDSRDGVSITGTTFGYNESTQIYAIIAQDSINISRYVGGTISINLSKDEGKNILLNQNKIIYDLKVNGGGSEIIITQSD